jgi:hypothetical protein
MTAAPATYCVCALGAPLYRTPKRGVQVGSLFPGALVSGTRVTDGEPIHDNPVWVCVGAGSLYVWSERVSEVS